MAAQGDLQGALSRYRAAHRLMRVPTTGLEVARAEAALAHLVEARAMAIDTAHQPASPGEPAIFQEARRAAERLAAELEPRIPSIAIRVNPEVDYTLTIDGIPLHAEARTLPFRTNPGEHEVAVKARGYVGVTERVTLAESRRETLQISLRAETPVMQPTAAPARVAPSSSDATDAPAQAARLRGYIALGVGGAVLGAGVVAGVLSWTQTSNLDRECGEQGCPPSAGDRLSRANTLANVANVAVPLGIVALGYGLYELLTHRGGPQPQAAGGLQLHADAHMAYAGWAGSL